MYLGVGTAGHRDKLKLSETVHRAIACKGFDAVSPLLRIISTRQAWLEIDNLHATQHPSASAVVWRRRYRGYRRTVTAQQWRDGANGTLESGVTATLLRRQGDTLETSRGAEVPWRDAERLFVLAQSVVHRGVHYVPEHHVRCGAFTLREIRADGTTIVGCHTLSFSEMERLAIREAQHLVKPRYPLPALVAA